MSSRTLSSRIAASLTLFLFVFGQATTVSAINMTYAPQQCSRQAAAVSLSPQAVTQGQMNVALTIGGFLLHAQDVTLDFGAGITVVGRPQSQASMAAQTTYTVIVNIAQTAPVGPHPVSIRYCGGKVKQTPLILMVNPAQACSERAIVASALRPGTLSQGQMNAEVHFTGRELEHTDVTLDFGVGVMPVGRPMAVGRGKGGYNEYRLNLNVLPSAPVGPHPVVVRYCGGRMRQTKAVLTVAAGAMQPAAGVPQAPQMLQMPQAKPNLLAVMPNTWEPGKAYKLMLAGMNLAEGMGVRFGDGVQTVSAMKVLGPTTAQVDVMVEPGAKGQRTAELLPAVDQPWMKTPAAVFIREVAQASGKDDGGTFRGKWWNYYDRGLSSAEEGDLDKALDDLRKAASMREKDQRMARTYGLHFTDYFPHRELGIVYFRLGDLGKARKELETSLKSVESAKASHFLNRVRKAQLQKQTEGRVKPPSVSIDIPPHGLVTRSSTVEVRGRAVAEGLVARIAINGNPYRFDTAKEEMPYRRNVQLSDGENRIVVRAEDLFGNPAEKSVTVFLDREGPSISIFDVALEERGGRQRVRITGEVSDNTGLHDVMINGKKTSVNNRKGHEFDVAFDRKELKGQLVIRAVDRVENETVAELDINRELNAFSRKPELVLYAFNSAALLSFDKEVPLVRLKDAEDIPAVYVDKYYVEGEVSDNGKVDKITVNGTEVPGRKGKKVFFSRLVGLKEGKNRISVEAVDGGGNRAVSEFTVTRNVPDVMQTGSRMRVTVLPFEVKQKATGMTDLAYDYLIGSFIDQKRFNVIERAKLEQVLQEQKIAKSKLADPEHSIKVGKLMLAEAIMATAIREDAKSIEVVTRVINTETSEVMEVKDVFTEDKGSAAVKELMEGLAAKVASGFPVVEGMVIKQDGREVYTDIGDSAKVQKSTGVIVYRKGKEIKHPVTGKSLGWDTVKVAEGRFEDIQKDFSKVKLVDKGGQGGVAVKDLIITK